MEDIEDAEIVINAEDIQDAKIAEDIGDGNDIENLEIAEDIKDGDIVSISQILDMYVQALFPKVIKHWIFRKSSFLVVKALLFEPP